MKPRVSSLPITAALVLTAIIAVLGGARPAAAAAPDAVDDYYSLYQGKTLVVPYNTLAAPWANDTDADGDIANANFECDLGSTAFYGSFTIDKNCGITYTPDPSFVGQDAAVYRLSDGSSSDLGVIYFEVKAGAPISQDDLYSTPQDTPINVPAPGVLANDSDPDGDPLIIAGYTQPADGTVTLNNDGSFTFTPNIGFFGYTYFQYQAWAGGLVSKNAVVTIDVQQEVNTPPVVQDDAYATTQDTPLDVPWPGVFANDSDPDGDQLFVDPAYSQPAKGTVTLNSDGTFTFTPDPGFVGSTNFQYQAYDGLAASNWATVTIDVQKANTPPVAQDDAYVTPQDTPLVVAGPGFLANDSDADGDQLYPGTYSLPAAGTLLLGPDGGFTYTPNPGFVGSDSFSYNAYDGLTGSQLSALVTIDVQAANGNTPPVVNDHSESAIEDDPGAKLVSLLFYASDPDSSGTLTVDSYTNPSHGSLVVDLATGDATYIPDPDYFGPDSFTYVVSDGTDLSAPGTVTIDVTPENDLPVCANQTYSTAMDTKLSVDAPGVLTGAHDVEGDTLTALLKSGASNGALYLDSDGQFVYEPNPGYQGVDVFHFRAFDAVDHSSDCEVAITVTDGSGQPGYPGPTPTPDPNDPNDPGDPGAPDNPGDKTGIGGGGPGTTTGNPDKTRPDRPNFVTALPDTGAGSGSRPTESRDLLLVTLLGLGGLAAAAGLRRFVAAPSRRG